MLNYCCNNLGGEGIRAYGANVRPVPSPDDVGPNAERLIEGHRFLAEKASKARNRITMVIGSDKLIFSSKL